MCFQVFDEKCDYQIIDKLLEGLHRFEELIFWMNLENENNYMDEPEWL